MFTFMQVFLGLSVLMMVGSIYLAIFVAVAPLWKKVAFCLYAAGLVYYLYKKTKKY